MDVVPRRYTKTNYEIIDVGYKAPVCKPESELARQNRDWKLACSPVHLCLTG